MNVKRNYEILSVSKGIHNPFVKMKVTLSDGSAVIRFGLDEDTYENMKEIVSKNYFDSLAKGYRFELLPNYATYQELENNQPVYMGSIKCIQGKWAKNLQFPCTARFAGNLEWFKQAVYSIEDIKHLSVEE
ncbi:hypothetical protein ABES02_04770 [Neobacillus pocheonensis]|uniref:hypothetical protein n=1 Tax=Neobacillus pocheonensis TaxID=363869 RepID=UPI003D2A860B